MTDRDRLIKLIQKWYENLEMFPYLADYLLANGVIVPPCKVGDKIYIVADVSKAIVESVVMGVWIIEDSISILTIHGVIINDSFGKTVFLTKEEAEAELRKRS